MELLEGRRLLSAVYNIEVIGTADITSEAMALNNAGEVVGHFSPYPGCWPVGNPIHAFVWSAEGGLQDLGTLGGNYSNAFAINSGGTIVGSAETASGESHPFVFSQGGSRDLGVIAGRNGGASYIDDQNRILAGVLDDQGNDHLLLYSNSKITDLGTLPNLERFPNGFGEAFYISDAGTVSVKITERNGDVHVYQPEDGELVEQGEYDLAGVALGKLLNLDNDVAITGRGKTLIVRHGQDIAQFKLSNKTAGLDKIWVNSAGAAVGYGYEKLNGETYDLPFILDGSVLRDLNSLIPAGWILDDATGISNAGQIIGNGWHNGARQGFLLTPIPGTVSDTLGPTDVALTTVATVSQRNSNHQKHHHRRSTASATRKGTVMLPRAFYGFA